MKTREVPDLDGGTFSVPDPPAIPADDRICWLCGRIGPDREMSTRQIGGWDYSRPLCKHCREKGTRNEHPKRLLAVRMCEARQERLLVENQIQFAVAQAVFGLQIETARADLVR